MTLGRQVCAVIYHLRTERGLTASELARLSGITKNKISLWETSTGRANVPSLNALESVARVLGKSVTEIVYLAEKGRS